MTAYLLGVFTTPLAWLALMLVVTVADSLREFRRGYGKGFMHEVEVLENGRWNLIQDTHRWPSITPWWLIRLAEPYRVRRCHRRPDYRPYKRVIRDGEL